jgi:hypothetical protein
MASLANVGGIGILVSIASRKLKCSRLFSCGDGCMALVVRSKISRKIVVLKS